VPDITQASVSYHITIYFIPTVFYSITYSLRGIVIFRLGDMYGAEEKCKTFGYMITVRLFSFSSDSPMTPTRLDFLWNGCGQVVNKLDELNLIRLKTKLHVYILEWRCRESAFIIFLIS